MENAVAQYKQGEQVLKIYHDCDAESPREWDNLGTMVCFHRRYDLGDKHHYSDSDEFLFDLLEQTLGDTDKAVSKRMNISNSIDFKAHRGHFQKAVDDEIIEVIRQKFIIMPLYLYDHSIQSISTGSFIGRAHHAEWDSGQVGWVYVSKADVRKEYSVKRITKKVLDRAVKVLEAEVEIFDQYLRGDIYGFVIEDKEGNHLDSCWGFHGDDPKENGMIDHIGNEWREAI